MNFGIVTINLAVITNPLLRAEPGESDMRQVVRRLQPSTPLFSLGKPRTTGSFHNLS